MHMVKNSNSGNQIPPLNLSREGPSVRPIFQVDQELPKIRLSILTSFRCQKTLQFPAYQNSLSNLPLKQQDLK